MKLEDETITVTPGAESLLARPDLFEGLDIESVVPTRDRLIVRPDPPPTQRGRIVLPDQSRPKPFSGTILSVGPDVKGFARGDRVIWSRYTGLDLPTEQGVFVLLAAPEVLATVASKH